MHFVLVFGVVAFEILSKRVALFTRNHHRMENLLRGVRYLECVQVAMAATPGANESNCSQWFITLDRCDWLNGKHTIFGKVVGSTIFNVLRMQELETDEADRPVEPPFVQTIKVVWNPFNDIKPRPKAAESTPSTDVSESVQEKRRRKKARKNYSLLSFGEEAQQEEGLNQSMPKIAAAHERLSNDTKLSTSLAVRPSQLEEETECEQRENQGNHTKDDNRQDQNNEPIANANLPERTECTTNGYQGVTGNEDATSTTEQQARKSHRKEQESKEGKRRQAERKAQRLQRMGVSKAANAIPEGERALMSSSELKKKHSKARRDLTAEREDEMLKKLKKFERSLLGTRAATLCQFIIFEARSLFIL